MGGGPSKYEEYKQEGKEQVQKIQKLKVLYPEAVLKSLARPIDLTLIREFGEPGRLFLDSVSNFQEVTLGFVESKTEVYILFSGVRRMIGDCKVHNEILSNNATSPRIAVKVLASLNATLENLVKQMDSLLEKVQKVRDLLKNIKFDDHTRNLQMHMETKLEELRHSNRREDAEGDVKKAVLGAFIIGLGTLLMEVPPLGLAVVTGGLSVMKKGVAGEMNNSSHIETLTLLKDTVEGVQNEIQSLVLVLDPLLKSLRSLLKMQQSSFQALQKDIQGSLQLDESWANDWELFYNRLLYTWSPICTAYIEYINE